MDGTQRHASCTKQQKFDPPLLNRMRASACVCACKMDLCTLNCIPLMKRQHFDPDGHEQSTTQKALGTKVSCRVPVRAVLIPHPQTFLSEGGLGSSDTRLKQYEVIIYRRPISLKCTGGEYELFIQSASETKIIISFSLHKMSGHFNPFSSHMFLFLWSLTYRGLHPWVA